MEEYNDAFMFEGYTIKGKNVSQTFLKWMNIKMDEAIEEENYEEAAKLKNEIQKSLDSQIDIKI